uniref:Putative Erf family protein n=1 Tax=viral metagenome TaxID=1070528 RepID=A0A6M3L2W8_9ZZZZ
MSLATKLAQVMYEAERIPKNGTAPTVMGGYKFVQVGDAADYIRKALAEKVVSMLPTAIEIVDQSEVPTKQGGSMTVMTVRTTWTLTDGESGETATIQSLGTGGDSGDKYSMKAQTSAMKYALLMGFLLSTGDDPEGATLPDRAPRNAEPKVEQTDDGGLVGEVQVGDKASSDFLVRQSPEGSALGFRLRGGRGGILVECRGPLADQLFAHRDAVVGKRVTVWGAISERAFTPKGKPEVTYQVLAANRVRVPDIGTLPADTTPEASEPSRAVSDGLDADQEAELLALEF